ncbi:helix-turn-helix domain-containing protein [bacterium]|nr:helix-turn-helix domain-containing protein [bacterium]
MANLKDKRAFSISEAARYAAVSRGTICSWLESGRLPFEELPTSGSYRFRKVRRVDLDSFLDRHYQDGSRKKEPPQEHRPSEWFLLPRQS